MSDAKSTSAGIPAVNPLQGLEDNKKTLEEKIARLEKLPNPDHPSFDHDGAVARAKRQLAEVSKALRKESK